MSQLSVYLIVAEKKRGKNQQILVNVREKQMHESLNEGCASNPQELEGGGTNDRSRQSHLLSGPQKRRSRANR